MRASIRLLASLAAIAALGGCRDSGLPDRNLPFEEAAHRPPDALVQAVHPETRAGHDPAAGAMPQDEAHAGASMAARPITVGEQTFVASGQPLAVGAGSLRAVGGSGSMSFSAAIGDDPPYDRLYLAHPGGTYLTYLPLHDATGDVNSRAAAAEHGLEGGAAAH
jgi:hypothetical protein